MGGRIGGGQRRIIPAGVFDGGPYSGKTGGGLVLAHIDMDHFAHGISYPKTAYSRASMHKSGVSARFTY